MVWQFDGSLRGVDNALCACLERGFELDTVRYGEACGSCWRTRGIISAGSWVNLCASSSSYEMRWAMSISQ